MKVNGYSDVNSANNMDLSKNSEVKEKKPNNDKSTTSSNSGMTINGSELHLGNESIEEKKKKAQKIAMELMENAFKRDNDIDREIEQCNERAEIHKKENEEYSMLLSDIKDEEQNLKEIYNVDSDSKEQSDLDLLIKEKESIRHPDEVKLTPEEKAELVKIKNKSLTEYQERMLKLDEEKFELNEKIDENKENIRKEYGTARGIALERLKYHDMVDAKKQGDEVIKAANKEVMGTIIDEAKKDIDDKYEDEKQKAEDKAEEEEIIEDRIEKSKEQSKEDEEKLEKIYELKQDILELSKNNNRNSSNDMKKSLDLIVAELQLSQEDLKGAAVDQNV